MAFNWSLIHTQVSSALHWQRLELQAYSAQLLHNKKTVSHTHTHTHTHTRTHAHTHTHTWILGFLPQFWTFWPTERRMKGKNKQNIKQEVKHDFVPGSPHEASPSVWSNAFWFYSNRIRKKKRCCWARRRRWFHHETFNKIFHIFICIHGANGDTGEGNERRKDGGLTCQRVTWSKRHL